MTNILSKRALLTKLYITKWTAQKTDKKISSKVEEENEASPSSGTYVKRLIKNPDLDKYTSLANRARQTQYKYTYPWMDSGFRILPSEVYFEYFSKINELKAEAESCVQSFLSDYEEARAKAKEELGRLFDPNDYPTVDKIQTKFWFDIQTMPLPDSGDWRIEATEEQLEKEKQKFEQSLQNTQKEVVEETWNRINEKLQVLYEKLINQEARLHKSTWGSVLELAELLPKMNVTEDHDINRKANEIREKLFSIDLKDVKGDTAYREAVAQEILSLMEE